MSGNDKVNKERVVAKLDRQEKEHKHQEEVFRQGRAEKRQFDKEDGDTSDDATSQDPEFVMDKPRFIRRK